MEKGENAKTKSHYEKQFQEEIEKLNKEQRKAVESIDGPVMVIAGPGTGKTQVIAARIGYILKSDQQVAPHNILCLTYTDAGTVAMRNRLLRFIGPTAYRVNIYTFHAFCNDIIQHNLDYFGKKELEPISEIETVHLLRNMIDSLAPGHPLKRLKGSIYYDVSRIRTLFEIMKQEDWSPDYISMQIDKYISDLPNRDEYLYKKVIVKQGIKMRAVNWKQINNEKEKMETLRAAAHLFPKYCEMMHEWGRYDYSDMILWVLNAFKKDENFLRRYQEWYQYFLVDEYQDTSGSQNELLQLLIDYWDKPNVFVVGDDDQCIYEFQGARLKNMTQFFEKYENDIEVIVLTKNYRSTQQILDASKGVIENNTQRLVNQPSLLNKIPNLTKTLVASGTDMVQGNLSLVEYYNILHEETSIVEDILQLGHQNFGEVAVIYYKHSQAENIISLLEKKRIPYNVKRKINILDIPIVDHLLKIFSYLDKEHQKPHSGEYLLFEIMHYKFFNISVRDIARISSYLSGNPALRWRDFLANYEELKKLNLESYYSVITFEENITRWLSDVSNVTLQMLFEKIINFSGLLKQILHDPDKIWLLQVITTLFDFIKSECAKRPLLTIGNFLETIWQMREEKISLAVNKTIYQENGVNLLTVHSAKGMEFNHVFMIGCTSDMWEKSRVNNNQFSLPDTLTFNQKKDENKLESLRRLFYVGMTRAKKNLQISFSKKTNEGKNIERSQYVEEIIEKIQAVVNKKHLTSEQIAEYTALALSDSSSLILSRSKLLEKEYIKNILENFRMSITHLNRYLECPVAFYYETILRVPSARNEHAAFGTVIHDTLKWLFNEMEKNNNNFPEKEKFVAEFKNQMICHRDAFTKQQYENLIAYGEKNLTEYYEKYVGSWNKIIKTEFMIDDIEVDGVPIKGKIDKIEFNGIEVNVVDYKTGKTENALKKLNPPSDKDPNGGDYWRQLVFYNILINNYKKQNWKMISGEIDFVEKQDKEKEFVKKKIIVTADDIAIVQQQIKDVYTKIMNHEFTEGCAKKDCVWCNFVKGNSAVLLNEKYNEEILEE